MIAAIQNEMRLQALRAQGARLSLTTAIVTSYDPNRYAAKVTLQPNGEQTGWLPVAAHWIGNGWGMYAPPSNGDQVNVEFVGDNPGGGTVTSRLFDANNKALSVPSGEFWLVHKSGAFFKLTNDGKLTFTDGKGATVQLNAAGAIEMAATMVNITSDVSISGGLTVGGGASGTFTTPTGQTVTVQDGIVTNIF